LIDSLTDWRHVAVDQTTKIGGTLPPIKTKVPQAQKRKYSYEKVY